MVHVFLYLRVKADILISTVYSFVVCSFVEYLLLWSQMSKNLVINHSDLYMSFCFSFVVILFKKGDKVLLVCLVLKFMYYST